MFFLPCHTLLLSSSQVAARLSELGDPGLLHMMVKQAVVMALDRKDRERELVSNLLCTLSIKVPG